MTELLPLLIIWAVVILGIIFGSTSIRTLAWGFAGGMIWEHFQDGGFLIVFIFAIMVMIIQYGNEMGVPSPWLTKFTVGWAIVFIGGILISWEEGCTKKSERLAEDKELAAEYQKAYQAGDTNEMQNVREKQATVIRCREEKDK